MTFTPKRPTLPLAACYVPLIHSVNESDTANEALIIRSGGRCASELMFAAAEIRRLLSYSAQASDAAELSLSSIQKSIESLISFLTFSFTFDFRKLI